jgi:hypothetical protein
LIPWIRFNINVGTFFNNDQVSQKDKLLALKIIKETCESKFSLIEKGPSVMALNSLKERVEKIETSNNVISYCNNNDGCNSQWEAFKHKGFLY